MKARALPLVLIALALSAALSIRTAHAAPPADPATQSMRAHFDAGVHFYDAKPPDYARALDEFRAAYRDKPSPIIKQNIALCLRALGRYVEAIDTLHEMLDEGADAIKPTVRDLANKAIAEMNDLIATAKVSIQARATPGASEMHPALILDGVLVPTIKMGAPLRLDPGEHRFRVHAEGYADASKTLTFAQGQRDVPIVMELVPMLTGDPPPPVLSPTSSAQPPVGSPPPTYDAATPPPSFTGAKRVPRSYAIAGLSLQSQQLRVLADEHGGTQRTFNGAAVLFRAGRFVDRYWDIGGLAELGELTADSYPSPNNTKVPAKTGLVNWVLAPELRVHSAGQLRLIGSIALGLEGTLFGTTLAQSDGTTKTMSSVGVGLMALMEAGGQLELGRAFVEGVVFFDVHGLGSMMDSNQRLVDNTAATRGGLRLLVGFRF